MLYENLPHYYKLAIDVTRGRTYLVERDVTEMQLCRYMRDYHEHRMPAYIYQSVSEDYWNEFKDAYQNAGRLVTLEACGGEIEANGDEW